MSGDLGQRKKDQLSMGRHVQKVNQVSNHRKSYLVESQREREGEHSYHIRWKEKSREGEREQS